MTGSKILLYAVTASIILASAFYVVSKPTKQAVEVQSDSSVSLQTLPDEASPKTLIQQLGALIDEKNWEALAKQLLTLRHSETLDQPALDFLSASESSGNQQLRSDRTRRLGSWLGAMRIALDERAGNPKVESEKLAKLLAAMDSTLQNKDVVDSYQSQFTDQISDIKQQITTLASAVELVGTSDIDSSDMTAPIGTAIEAVLSSNR